MEIKKPVRVTRQYTQHLLAPLQVVFPLLCPVRETEWVAGWDPEVVFTISGVAEPDCVFLTRDDSRCAVWILTRYDPAAGRLEYLKITLDVTACKISIALEPGADKTTEATIAYTHTALGPEGEMFVQSFTSAHYTAFMQEWERALNAYLQKLQHP